MEAVSKSKETITPADYLFNFKQNYNLDYDSTDVIDKVKVRRLSLRSKSQDQYVRSMKVYINGSTISDSPGSLSRSQRQQDYTRFLRLEDGNQDYAGSVSFQDPSGR